MTQSGDWTGRNIALRRVPDLMLANRLIAPSSLSMKMTMETGDVHPEGASAHRMKAPSSANLAREALRVHGTS
jgi:hypothetical protein